MFPRKRKRRGGCGNIESGWHALRDLKMYRADFSPTRYSTKSLASQPGIFCARLHHVTIDSKPEMIKGEKLFHQPVQLIEGESTHEKMSRRDWVRYRRRPLINRIRVLLLLYFGLILLASTVFVSEATTTIKSSRDSVLENNKNDTNAQEQQTHQQRQQSSNIEELDSVLILVSVDGTMAGVSRSSGEVLWKRSQSDAVSTTPSAPFDQNDNNSLSTVNKFLSPLVSTTTKSSGYPSLQWHAVPSIDGIVYLTGGGESTDESSSSSSRELSISTHIRDLVERAPFVDGNGRFFVGSRRAMVAAVDERTGEILRVIPKWKSVEKREKKTADSDGNANDGYKNDDDSNEEELLPSLDGRDVVWIGRLEHSVTVHDLQKNTVDVEFSVAEILSVEEMIHGKHSGPSSIFVRDDDLAHQDTSNDSQNGPEGDDMMQRLFTEYFTEALRHPSPGSRILTLPAPDETVIVDSNGNKFNNNGGGRGGNSFLVSTPGGNVAFRDSISSDLGWVAFEMTKNPVVYAIEGVTGEKIRVNVLPDGSTSDSSASDSNDGNVPQIFEKQIASLIYSSMLTSDSMDCSDETNSKDCRAITLAEQGSIVGTLQDGQLYALPLGERSPLRLPQLPLGLPQPSQKLKQDGMDQIHSKPLNQYHAIGFNDDNSDGSGDSDTGDKQHLHVDPRFISSCTPKSPLYPGCLIGASLMMGNLLDVNGNLDMASVFASADLDYDLYLDMMEGKSAKKNSIFQQFIKILSSWIAPTVALIFVVSFEFGRRERLKAIAKSPSIEYLDGAVTNGDDTESMKLVTSQGVIQISDEVLGYGGHGTIVYKGVVDKRQVAVKRLLKIYASSADREISLLIESDGHPNVVRYFLKEIRGDFVYLALELCDMSLNDLIVCLGKLRNEWKTDEVESATRSLLYQIASGVRHIHSLRIVVSLFISYISSIVKMHILTSKSFHSTA